MKWIYSFTTRFTLKKVAAIFTKPLLALAIMGWLVCLQTVAAQSDCIAIYQIENLPDGTFQVSMTSNVDYNASTTIPENQISSMQVTIRVKTGGFAVSNFNDLRHGFTNWNVSTYNAPIENPGFDYISFTLNNPTLQIPFQSGLKVPLFTFENGGILTGDAVNLVDITDPFYPPNASNTNIGQQLAVFGNGELDASLCIVAEGAQDGRITCGVEYKISKRSDGRFLVSMIPQVTYLSNGIDNQVSTMQVVVKVATGSFQVANINDLVHSSMLWDTTIYSRPAENTNFDYIAFGLRNRTDDYSFISGQEVPLFTFENGGICTNNLVSLIDETDPFYPPNASNSNTGQQLTVAGYGQPDIPICVSGSGAQDCSTNCFLSCDDNIQVSLGLNCTAEILPNMVASALDLTCPGGTKSVEVRYPNNTIIPTSPMVDQSHINQTFLVSVVDDNTGNSCWGSILVKDKTGPSITCPDLVVDCSESLNPNNPVIGFPTVRDNCFNDAVDISYDDEVDPNGCNSIYSTIVRRTWTANDGADHGIESKCVQQIYLRALPLEDIVFPIDRDGIDAPALPCQGEAIDPDISGGPMLNGKSIYPSYEGYCDITVGFQDQVAGACGGSSRILRTWTAVDNCTGQFRTDIQVISLLDLEAPVFECINDTLEQSTGIHNCATDFNLPSLNVSDVCSEANVYMITPNGTINSNGGLLEDITQGLHPIIYVATDECGNEARCTLYIQIRDQNGPTVICNDNQVAIGPSGWVDVPASTFDDGSYDDCCGNISFLAQRTDQVSDFLEVLSFGCEDIGKTIPITLRVTDCFGNISQCTATITIIHDNTANFQCPPNLTIACTADYSDLSVFGAPTLSSGCGDPIFRVENTFNLDSCGAGTIIRDFFILNNGVPVGNCTQVITVENESTFTEHSITWPHDYLALACEFESLDPDDLPFGFDKPKYDVTSSCNNIFITHSDKPFDNSANPEGCYEIHRRWELIDWCKYDPDNPSAGGIFTYTQIINILNNVPPVFNCPLDVTVDTEGDDCVGFVNLVAVAVDDCTPSNLLSYRYSIDQDSDGTQDISGLVGNASGFYPIGTHTVTFTAEDDCGNSAECTYVFTVRDGTAPRASCFFPDVVIENHNGSLAAIPDASVIGQPSVDNCSAFEDLTFRVQPSFFTCEEVGINTITLTVLDEAGNSSTCSGQINVVDLLSNCPRLRSMVAISGNVINEDGAMVENVLVSLDYNDVMPSMTDQDGAFQLDSVPVGGDYTVYPKRNDEPLNGISTYDLIVLNRHILGIQYINSPYKLIAADVNRSGSITTYDLVILRRLILRNIDNFPNNTSWRFVKQDFQFADTANPFEAYIPEVYAIENTPSNDMHIGSFIAIKVGDINNSAQTSTLSSATARNAKETWSLHIPTESRQVGEIIDIPVFADKWQEVLGFQFGLEWDAAALEIVEVLPGSLPNLTTTNFGLQDVAHGQLSVSWEQASVSDIPQEPLFTLRAIIKQQMEESTTAFAIDETYLAPEVYYDLATPKIASLKLSTEVAPPKVVLYQNQPNPFQAHTLIRFDLPAAQTATIQIIDRQGQLVKQIAATYSAGRQEVLLKKSDFPTTGIYYYRLKTAHSIETKKMLIIE